MLKHLARIARRNGISGFTAEVLAENKGMQAVFDRSEFKVQSKYRGDVYSYKLSLKSSPSGLKNKKICNNKFSLKIYYELIKPKWLEKTKS